MFSDRRLIRHVAAWMLFAICASPVHGQQPIPEFADTRPVGERVPYPPLPDTQPEVPTIRFGRFRPFNPIDNFILQRIQAEKIRPQDVCNDWDFARRTSLDIVGVIPTLEDLERFLAWKPKQRRSKWIDLLLGQKLYADHWTIFWGDVLRERGRVQGLPDNALKHCIQKSLTDNQPFDAFVRTLITADGIAEENPATAFVMQDRAQPEVLTVAVSEAFLGVQLRCAQCHDHPFDWWTKKDFEGMSDFWRGTRTRVIRTDEITLPNGTKTRVPRFELVSQEKMARGVFITGRKSEAGAGREALADLLTRRDNPYFARVVVNRLWEKLMGQGLVTPASSFSPLNPPSHPELLDWLAIEFIEHNYDLKHMIRLMANSRTYQQSSSDSSKQMAAITRRNREKSAEEAALVPGALFESSPLRRMTAEQIHDSILVATGRFRDARRRYQPAIDFIYPPGPQSFLRIFGASDRETVSPRPTAATIQQSLTLLNGDFINSAVRYHPDHPLRRWSSTRSNNINKLTDALFLQTLTRPPNSAEQKIAARHIGRGNDDDAWEDLLWALLNSREFQFIR